MVDGHQRGQLTKAKYGSDVSSSGGNIGKKSMNKAAAISTKDMRERKKTKGAGKKKRVFWQISPSFVRPVASKRLFMSLRVSRSLSFRFYVLLQPMHS